MQRGNVLFLILIAVALFGALSYAVTSSTRNGGGSVSKEKAKTYAAQIMQHTASMTQAIMRMKISKGCTTSTIDVSTPVYQTIEGTMLNSTNTNSPADKSCSLFDPAGGGISPIIPPAEALSPGSQVAGSFKPGHIKFNVRHFTGVGTDGVAADQTSTELNAGVSSVKVEVCIAINEALGVSNPGGLPPEPANNGSSGGSFVNGSMYGALIFDDPITNGHPAFCFKNNNGLYSFLDSVIIQ